jgi:hypothetical protein
MTDRPLSQLLQDVELPGHVALAQHWLDLYARHGRIPRLADIDPTQFPKALADVWMVDAESDGRFRVRLTGQTLVTWYGRSPKGLYYEELFGPEILPVVVAQANRVLHGRSIGLHQMNTTVPDWSIPASFRRLAMPLADGEGRLRHMIGATLFSNDSHHEASHGKGGIATQMQHELWYAIPAQGSGPEG